MKRIISLLICFCMILSVAPVTIFAAEDPGYSGGTLIGDYTLDADFGASELGKLVIGDKTTTSTLFDSTYTNDGLTISRTSASSTNGNAVATLAIKFAALIGEKDTENNTETYQQGFSGIYAFEVTMNCDVGKNKGTRTDFYIQSNIDSTATNAAANIRYACDTGAFKYYQSSSSNAFNYTGITRGEDYTFRFVVDTNNDKLYGYDVDAEGNYTYKKDADYTSGAVGSLVLSPRPSYWAAGSSITFKNIKVYEIDPSDETASTLNAFKEGMPDRIVDDYANITENITIPDTLSAYTVTSSDENVLKKDGTVIRGFTDQNVALIVTHSSDDNKLHFKKIFNFVVKEREGVNPEVFEDYDYTTADDTKEFISSGDSGLTSDGYKIVKTSGTTSKTIGMLKTEKDSDTYVYDHTGAYDYEIEVKPNVTSGKAYVEVGNYNSVTGQFTGFAKFSITPSGIAHSTTNGDTDIITETTTDNSYTLKFRVDQGERQYWLWAGDNLAQKEGVTYTALKNVLNAYCISFDNDATDGDSVTLVSGKLTKQIYTEYAPVENALSVAASMSVDDITENPEDAYGDINLPTEEGYNIVWTADNALVDLENKKVYRSDKDEEITLTATITTVSNPDVKVVKDFHITVKEASDPSQLLEGDLAKITAGSLTNQNLDALITDLVLPDTSESGYDLDWSSLNPTIISDEGKINRTINISQPTQVGLEVIISDSDSGAELPPKTIYFTVAKRGADVTLDCNNLVEFPEAVEGVVTYQATVTKQNGTVYMQDDAGNNIIGVTIEGSELTFDYKGDTTTTTVDGGEFDLRVVMNSADKCASVFVDDKLILDYVPYITNVTNFKKAVVNGTLVPSEKVILDEYSFFDYNIKVFDYYDGLEQAYVEAGTILNFKKDALPGAKVEWISSNEQIMSGNDGIYHASSFISFYDMTLKITKENGTGATYEDAIKFVAVPADENNVMKNAIVGSNIRTNVSNTMSKVYDKDLSTYVSGTIESEDEYMIVDLGTSDYISSMYIFQSPENKGMLSCDIYASTDGTTWGETPIASPIFTDLESNLVFFDTQKVRYIKLTNIATEDGGLIVNEIKGYIGSRVDDKAVLDIKALGMPESGILTATSLPLLKVGPLHGSTLVWTSSNENIISLDGTVNPPEARNEVILTVTATYNDVTITEVFRYQFTGASSGGGAGGGAGGGIGGPSGVNTGGSTIAALPNAPEFIQTPSEENLKTEFGDVKMSDWYYQYLLKLKEAGIISGYDDGNFYPNNLVKREEFLKMLVIASKLQLSDTSEGFADVNTDDWFAPYVYTAKESGIANGVSDTSFGVGMPISRQDMSVMIFNILGIDLDTTGNTGLFADDDSIADYAYKPVYVMKQIGLINGYENGEFNPAGQLTRAEATKVISMVMNYFK